MTSSPSRSAWVSARPCVSTTPTTTSMPSCRFGPGGLQHLVGLADAGRGAEKDLQAAAAPSPGAPPRAARRARVAGSDRAAVGHARSMLCPLSRSRATLPWGRRVERQVEGQHVDARLADEAEEPALDVRADELPDRVLGQVRGPWRRAAPGTAPPRARCAGRGRCPRWSRGRSGPGTPDSPALSASTIALDALEQSLAGRAEVRAGRVRGVVGRRHGLRGVRRIGRGGRRGPAMEVAVAREALADQRGADRPGRPSRSGCRCA